MTLSEWLNVPADEAQPQANSAPVLALDVRDESGQLVGQVAYQLREVDTQGDRCSATLDVWVVHGDLTVEQANEVVRQYLNSEWAHPTEGGTMPQRGDE